MKTIGIQLAVDTNGPAFNLEKVIQRHGLEADFFDGQVLDILTAQHGKPTAERAAEVVKRFGITDPARAVYLDDSPDVLRTMKEVGFKTIWINDTGKKLTDEQRAFIVAEYANPGDFVQDMVLAQRKKTLDWEAKPTLGRNFS